MCARNIWRFLTSSQRNPETFQLARAFWSALTFEKHHLPWLVSTTHRFRSLYNRRSSELFSHSPCDARRPCCWRMRKIMLERDTGTAVLCGDHLGYTIEAQEEKWRPKVQLDILDWLIIPEIAIRRSERFVNSRFIRISENETNLDQVSKRSDHRSLPIDQSSSFDTAHFGNR